MKKNRQKLLCGLILVLVVVDMLCDLTREPSYPNNEIPAMQLLNFYLLTPLLWISVGSLMGSVLTFGEKLSPALQKALRVLALVFVIAYGCVVLLLQLQVQTTWTAAVLRFFVRSSGLFVLPGLLWSLGGQKESC